MVRARLLICGGCRTRQLAPESAAPSLDLPDQSRELADRRPHGLVDAAPVYGYDMAAGLLGVWPCIGSCDSDALARQKIVVPS